MSRLKIHKTYQQDPALVLVEIGKMKLDEAVAMKQRQSLQSYLPRAYDRKLRGSVEITKKFLMQNNFLLKHNDRAIIVKPICQQHQKKSAQQKVYEPVQQWFDLDEYKRKVRQSLEESVSQSYETVDLGLIKNLPGDRLRRIKHDQSPYFDLDDSRVLEIRQRHVANKTYSQNLKNLSDSKMQSLSIIQQTLKSQPEKSNHKDKKVLPRVNLAALNKKSQSVVEKVKNQIQDQTEKRNQRYKQIFDKAQLKFSNYLDSI